MHPSAAPHLAAVPRYVPGRLAAAPEVALASNESPYGASRRATEAATEAMLGLHRYPVDGGPALVAALAARHGLSPDEIRVTNGATEAINLLCRAFPGEVVLPEGAFPAYARAALAAGSRVREVARRGWHADLDGMRSACGPDTRLLFLANPDNPTGTEHGRGALAAWLWGLPHHVVVVIDEAYVEYSPSGLDALQLRRLHPNVVVLRSFSKVHGLAALRVGWLTAPADIAAVVDRLRDPFNLNSPGIAAALAALDDAAHVALAVARNAVERDHLAAALRGRGFSPAPSAANFLCVPVPGTGTAVAAGLAARGIGVRSLDEWGLPGAVRITVGTALEHARLLAALDTLLDGRRGQGVAA